MAEQKEDKIVRSTEIKVQIHLNEGKMPVAMDWDATDSPVKGAKPCKAAMVALWDGEAKITQRLDLWTKEMQVDEMNYFFFQTFMTMADTFHRATNNKEASMGIRKFGQEFATKLGLFDKKK